MVCESTQIHAEDCEPTVPTSLDELRNSSETTIAGTIEDMDLKLVMIESDLLPKLTKERTDAEDELHDLLAQVAEENKQLRIELEQRREKFHTLFAEYTKLKPLLVASCKRSIRESRGWTSHAHATDWKKADDPNTGREWNSEHKSYDRNWKSSYGDQQTSSNESEWRPAYNAPKQETSECRWNSSSTQKPSYSESNTGRAESRWNSGSGTNYNDQKPSYNENNKDRSESRWNSNNSNAKPAYNENHNARSENRWNAKPAYNEPRHDSTENRWRRNRSSYTVEPDAHDEDAFKPRWSTEVAAAKRVEKWDSQWVKTTRDESSWWKGSTDSVTYKARDGSRWTPQEAVTDKNRCNNWNTEYYKAPEQELPRHVLDRIASVRPVQEKAAGEYVSLC